MVSQWKRKSSTDTAGIRLRGDCMGLDKTIEHGKEKRKPYDGSKAIDKTCRNHGGCPWCEENRLYQSNKEQERCEQELEDWENEVD